ncbi:MAG: transglycosylase SLT domain-containing protein [Pseudomonadota bacterium]
MTQQNLLAILACLFLGLVIPLASGSAQAADIDLVPRIKPPAPGPAYITADDLARINVIRDDLKRGSTTRAWNSIQFIKDPTAQALGKWYYFYSRPKKVSFQEGAAFLAENRNWPAASRIQGHIEKSITPNTSTAEILDFFDERDPVTSHGILALIRAYYAAQKPEAAALFIKDAWKDSTFADKDERAFLANYGGVLTSNEFDARVDRLLWKRQVSNASRHFARMSPDARRRAKARAGLLSRSKNAVRNYERLSPDDRQDAGVVHAAMRYFRRSDEEPRAIAIARTAPQNPEVVGNEGAYWLERNLLMRWALKNRLYEDAYAMAAGHAIAPGTTNFSEAEFNAGWIALRFLGKPERASVHFAALTASVSAPISVARGQYWLGRAASAMGDENTAKLRYRSASQYPYTFYGQMAIEHLNEDSSLNRFTPASEPTVIDKTLFASRPLAKALRMLTDIADARSFLLFSYALDDQLTTPGEFQELADAAARLNAPHVTVRAGKAGVRSGILVPQVSYPSIYVPNEASRFVPPEVILGLSRQESEFNPTAYSRAGARGMMQLLPSTAQITARKEGLPYRRSALLTDQTYNMTIGSAHLSHLLRDFNGSYPMVFAAYNAGPHRVKQWIVDYGDPRLAGLDPIDWMELIPFSETRNYVQRVLENIQIYRSQLNEGPIAGKLSRDIERGGVRGRIAQVPPRSSKLALAALQTRIDAIANPVLTEPVPHIAELDLSGEADPVDTGDQSPRPQGPATRPLPAEREPPQPTPAPAVPPKAKPAAPEQGTQSISSETPASAPPQPMPEQKPVAKAQAGDQPLTQEASGQTPLSGNGELAASQETSTLEMLQAAQLEAAGIIDAESEVIDPIPNGEFSDSVAAEADEACLTYTDFILEADGEEASAADLNAGMLAELSAGPAPEECGPQEGPASQDGTPADPNR